VLAIISQALKWLLIHVWFLELFSFSIFIFSVEVQALNYSQGIYAFPFVTFTACMPIFSDLLIILTCLSSSPPPHTHSNNYAISEEEHDTFVLPVLACHICYLAVISHLSILLNVCINRCYACFFAPMPCATLMESVIHCMRTQLATHTHTHTNQHCCLWQFLGCSITCICVMFAHAEWF